MNLNPKIRNATVGGALSVLIVYLLTGVLNLDLPAEVIASIPVIIAAAVGYGTSQGSWAPKS